MSSLFDVDLKVKLKSSDLTVEYRENQVWIPGIGPLTPDQAREFQGAIGWMLTTQSKLDPERVSRG